MTRLASSLAIALINDTWAVDAFYLLPLRFNIHLCLYSLHHPPTPTMSTFAPIFGKPVAPNEPPNTTASASGTSKGKAAVDSFATLRDSMASGAGKRDTGHLVDANSQREWNNEACLSTMWAILTWRVGFFFSRSMGGEV